MQANEKLRGCKCGKEKRSFADDGWALWIAGDDYELHIELKADDMNLDLRDELISVSKSGKNAAAKGVMGKSEQLQKQCFLSRLIRLFQCRYRKVSFMIIMAIIWDLD